MPSELDMHLDRLSEQKDMESEEEAEEIKRSIEYIRSREAEIEAELESETEAETEAENISHLSAEELSTGKSTDKLTDKLTDDLAVSLKKDMAAKLAAREIPVICRPDVLPQAVIDRIITWYRIGGTPINKILASANAILARFHRRPISFVDVYSVLMLASIDGKHGPVSTKHLNNVSELSIDEFGSFYKTWKEGGSFADCYRATKRVAQNKRFCQRIFASLMERWKKLQNSKTRVRMADADIAIRDVLEFAERRVFPDGRTAIVIFIDRIPVDLIAECGRSVDGFINIFGADIYAQLQENSKAAPSQ